jgi:hypothetical protein
MSIGHDIIPNFPKASPNYDATNSLRYPLTPPLSPNGERESSAVPYATALPACEEGEQAEDAVACSKAEGPRAAIARS